MPDWRFDTRDTKPKLYSLLILTAVTVLAVALLFCFETPLLAPVIAFVIAGYGFLACFLLLRTFREQIRYNLYSYNTIYHFGFALFALFFALSHLLLGFRLLSVPEDFRGLQILLELSFTARNYLFLTVPFLFAFSAGMVISNVVLLLRERKSFSNVLGILLSLVITAGAVGLYAYDFYASGSMMQVLLHELVVSVFSSVYLYFECMLIGTIVADVIAAGSEPAKDVDFLIILGCGLKPDGSPTPLLRGRIERAVSFACVQKKETGKDLVFIASGGKGPDEQVSESSAIRNCLLEMGIPEERILEEDRSTDTYENMLYSKDIIMEKNPKGRIAFSTTNYHVFRSGLFARRVKMRAFGMGARTKWYFWPNAAVREFIGLLTNHRRKQVVILCCMVFFYVVFTLLGYLW